MAVAGFECPRLGFAVKVSELTGRDLSTLDPHNKSEAHLSLGMHGRRPKPGAHTRAPCTKSMCQAQAFDIPGAVLVEEPS